MKSKRTIYPVHPKADRDHVVQNYSCSVVSAESAAATCGARTRNGPPCRNLPMKNGRCRMHGGASTGAKTLAGLARVRTAAWIHGGRSREMIEFRRRMRELQADARRMIERA